MTVFAVMKNGRSMRLAAELGAKPREVIDTLFKDTMTGSAAPLADVWLSTESGDLIRYSDIERLEQGPDS